MDANTLLDAIGMVDDRFLQEKQPRRTFSVRKKLVALLAAVMILGVSFGTVMAASQELPQLLEGITSVGAQVERVLISLFNIPTTERPPESTPSTEHPGLALRPVDVADIDGKVYAHYFAGDGYIQLFEGGFYTCNELGTAVAPEEFKFWELQKEGVVEVPGQRVEFDYPGDGYEIEVLFDYAVIHGRLCFMPWSRFVEGNMTLSYWNVEAVGNRTDVALLSVPVAMGTDYTFDYLLLDMKTLETTPFAAHLPLEAVRVDYMTFSEDLRYGLCSGADLSSGMGERWFCDMEQGTMVKVDDLLGFTCPEVYFQNKTTLICQKWNDGLIDIIRYDILTGNQTVLLEAVKRAGEDRSFHRVGKNYGILNMAESASVLVDLRTGEQLPLTGIDLENASVKENLAGTAILVAYSQKAKDNVTSNCYPKLGLLNPTKEEMMLMTRQISGNAEYIRGWLDDRTVVLTSHDSDGGYYVYLYEFLQ